MTKIHADASPSSSSIWINCPASVTKARGKERKATPYTREGTAAHSLAEFFLKGKRTPLDQIVVEGEVIDVTEEMIAAVDVYVHYVRSLDGTKHYEERVYIEHAGEQLFGTSDCFAIDYAGKSVEVVDFKYGQGVMVWPDTPQLKIYGLGVLNHIGPFEEINNVDLTIVQPRADTENPVKTVSFTVRELAEWERETLMPALDRVAAGDLTETPGDHCRWCVRAGECDALAALAMSNAKAAFGDILPEPETLANDELGLRLDHAQMIYDWYNKVRAEASARIDRGGYVPGWKLVAKRASRRWADPVGAVTELMRRGLDPMTIMRIETIGGVESAMKRSKVPLTILDEFTVKASSGSTLVSEKDGRPAVDNSAQSAFSDLSET